MSKYVQIKDIEFNVVYEIVDPELPLEGVTFYFPEQVLCKKILMVAIVSKDHPKVISTAKYLHDLDKPIKFIVSEKHRSSIFKELYE